MSKQTKQCNHCKKTKPYSDFQRRAAIKDGHDGTCKACRSSEQKAHRAANPETTAEYQRRWRERNPEAWRKNVDSFKKVREESKKNATNLRTKWSEADLVTVMRADITLVEISKMLGRTYGSVAAKKSLLVERQQRAELIAETQRRVHG